MFIYTVKYRPLSVHNSVNIHSRAVSFYLTSTLLARTYLKLWIMHPLSIFGDETGSKVSPGNTRHSHGFSSRSAGEVHEWSRFTGEYIRFSHIQAPLQGDQDVKIHHIVHVCVFFPSLNSHRYQSIGSEVTIEIYANVRIYLFIPYIIAIISRSYYMDIDHWFTSTFTPLP